MSSSPAPRGFTLVETIVAIGILVVLLTVVATAYGRFVGVQREGVGQQEMQEDVRLFLQLFNREARTAFGTTYQQTVNPPGVVFRNQESACVFYTYDAGQKAVTRAEAIPAPNHPCADLGIYGAGRRLTDTQNTVIAGLQFEVVTASADPVTLLLTQQGFITVYLDVHPAADPTQPMPVQSTVTSRQFTPYIP